MSYERLTHEAIYQIQVLLKAGMNQREIAMILERHSRSSAEKIFVTRALVAIAQNKRSAWLNNASITRRVIVLLTLSEMMSDVGVLNKKA